MKRDEIATPAMPATRRARNRRSSWRKILVYVVGLGVLVVILAGLLPKPIPVDTGKVTRGALTVSVLEEGKTRIRHRYTISAPVAGKLNRVPLRAGAAIQARKTVLATIEPASSGFLDERTRAQGEARVRSAEATRMLREAELGRAKAELELAQREFARIDALLKSKSVSKEEWDTADNRVQVLTRAFNSSEFAVRVAEFEIDQAKAALLPLSALQPGSTEPIHIMAPIDGFVLNVMEESEHVVAVGTAIMEVGDTRDLEAEIELLSSDAVAVAPGASVSIEQWGGEQPLRGRVSLVEPGGFTKISALGVEEQRVRVRVDFLDPIPGNHQLGDRYRVEARIVTWQGDDVAQIPTGALFRRGSEWMTFVVGGGKARQKAVQIDHNNGTAAQVLSGVAEGDTVILHPPDSIKDGASVRVAQARK